MDSNDRERVAEARDELNRMLNEDELREAILLVFANKQVRIITNQPIDFSSTRVIKRSMVASLVKN